MGAQDPSNVPYLAPYFHQRLLDAGSIATIETVDGMSHPIMQSANGIARLEQILTM